MHSVPFFTTSPTPSPTRPLHVPYTSPTSPTNFPSVVRFRLLGASSNEPSVMAALARAIEWRQQGLLTEEELQAANQCWTPLSTEGAPPSRVVEARMVEEPKRNVQFDFRNLRMAHRRFPCFTVKEESVPSEKTFPPSSGGRLPRTPR